MRDPSAPLLLTLPKLDSTSRTKTRLPRELPPRRAAPSARIGKVRVDCGIPRGLASHGRRKTPQNSRSPPRRPIGPEATPWRLRSDDRLPLAFSGPRRRSSPLQPIPFQRGEAFGRVFRRCRERKIVSLFWSGVLRDGRAERPGRRPFGGRRQGPGNGRAPSFSGDGPERPSDRLPSRSRSWRDRLPTLPKAGKGNRVAACRNASIAVSTTCGASIAKTTQNAALS